MARILLATQDTVLYETLDAELSGEGHETVWAPDGAEALALALEEALQAALLDRSLPVYPGLTLCAMLREDPDIDRGLPVYVLSDEALEPHAVERAGVTGVFPKTHEAGALRELVSAAALWEPAEE